MDNFERKVEDIPGAEDMRKISQNNPEKIRENGDKLIEDLGKDKKELLDEINAEKTKTGNHHDHSQLDALRTKVEDIHTTGKDNVKEGSNVAIDVIDDTEVTEHLIYKAFPLILALENSGPIALTLNILFRFMINKSTRF